MNENEDQSPVGRGFIAASIVIGAVLLCGALLLITGLTSDPADASAGTATSEPAQTTTGSSAAATPATESGPGQPATPATESTPAATGQLAGSGCALPAGDQTIPTKPPSVDTWDVSRRVVVPRSTTNGPAKTDPDGFRHCFAQSPTGAVYAAYNVIAAIADQQKVIPTARKLMLPGSATDALIRDLSNDEPSTNSSTTQVAGYRVLDADRSRATVMLAFPVESAYMSATLTLVWYDGDWRLQPPPPGEPVGGPFAQHRDLSDFVPWSGV
ncbi:MULTISPECIES: hypothetical protein [unclassified Kribbella]|uniref:hypothetical protein n=1 Tax=unclassified Kribbella TaxID=2644121 RepID=UPI003018F4B3